MHSAVVTVKEVSTQQQRRKSTFRSEFIENDESSCDNVAAMIQWWMLGLPLPGLLSSRVVLRSSRVICSLVRFAPGRDLC